MHDQTIGLSPSMGPWASNDLSLTRRASQDLSFTSDWISTNAYRT